MAVHLTLRRIAALKQLWLLSGAKELTTRLDHAASTHMGQLLCLHNSPLQPNQHNHNWDRQLLHHDR